MKIYTQKETNDLNDIRKEVKTMTTNNKYKDLNKVRKEVKTMTTNNKYKYKDLNKVRKEVKRMTTNNKYKDLMDLNEDLTEMTRQEIIQQVEHFLDNNVIGVKNRYCIKKLVKEYKTK